MTGLLKNMLVWFSVVLIVAATGGIGIFQTSCHCGDQVSEPRHCSTEGDQQCCANETEEGSAREIGVVPTGVPVPTPCPAGENCCSTVYFFFKTDLVNLAPPIPQSFKFHTAYQVKIADENSSYADDNTHVQWAKDEPPPNGFGKPLLIKLHQLKTDPQIG